MKRLQWWHGGHGGAVGIGDDAFRRIYCLFRVNLSHHERNLGVHSPTARVVDHDDASLSKTRSLLLRQGGTSTKDCDIQPCGVRCGDSFDDYFSVTKRQGRSCTPGGGKETDRIKREVTLEQKLPDDLTHLTGGTHHTDRDH